MTSPGLKKLLAKSLLVNDSLTLSSNGCAASASPPPIATQNRFSFDGRCVMSFPRSFTSALMPVCRGVGGGPAGCCTTCSLSKTAATAGTSGCSPPKTTDCARSVFAQTRIAAQTSQIWYRTFMMGPSLLTRDQLKPTCRGTRCRSAISGGGEKDQMRSANGGELSFEIDAMIAAL